MLAYELSDEGRTKLNTIIPDNPNQPYDMREVIEELVDTDSFMEVHRNFAENIVVGFARIGGPEHWHCGQSAGRAGGGAGH